MSPRSKHGAAHGAILFLEDVISPHSARLRKNGLPSQGSEGVEVSKSTTLPPILATPRQPIAPSAREPKVVPATPRLPRLRAAGQLDAPSSDGGDGEAFPPKEAGQPRKVRGKHAARRPQSRTRLVSDRTLSELVGAKDKFIIFRGDELEEELQRVQVEMHEKAHHRRDVLNKASEKQRARARQHDVRRRKILAELAAAECEEANQPFDWRTMARDKNSQGLPHSASSEDDHIVLRPRRASLGNARPTPQENDSTKANAKLKFHNSKAQRLEITRQAAKSSWISAKQQRALRKRTEEFNELSSSQQDALKHAFQRYENVSGTVHSMLEPLNVRNCLDDLGVQGNTDSEKRALWSFCSKIVLHGEMDFLVFALEVVPKARTLLREVQRAGVLEHFNIKDSNGIGTLDERQCWEVVEKYCMGHLDGHCAAQLRERFHQTFSTVKRHHDDQVDFEGFQQIITDMREHAKRFRDEREREIVEVAQLREEDCVRHQDEMLSLYECFYRHDKGGKGLVDEPETIGALLESGLMPRSGEARKSVRVLVHNYILAAPNAESLDFISFLRTVRGVREETQRSKLPELTEAFARYDLDRSGELSLAETSIIFSEIGLAPRCQQDQDEMKKIFDEVDHNASGSLDFDEFQDLVQRVTEKLRSAQRRRENEAGRQLGFTPQEISELRESFFNLDDEGFGELSIVECRTTLLMMKKTMSGPELNSVFNQIDRDKNEHIDFTEFLYFVYFVNNKDFDLGAALKMLPEK